MAGVNKAILVGNLGKDPEVRRLESGAVVTNFPIATTESYKNRDGEKVEKTEWHNIVMWRGLAEIAEKYLKKGDPVYIEGKIETRSYEQDGVTKYRTEIVAREMQMLSRRRDDDSQGERQKSSTDSSSPDIEPIDDPDDLPF